MTIDGGGRHSRISHALLKMILEFNKIERSKHQYGTERKLFFSEIHMIQFIKEHEGLHISSMAEKLSITKGAVSQIARKLQKKGMIVKETDPTNQTRILLHLTPEGELAYEAHEAMHAQLNKAIEDLLKDASAEERAFLERFLVHLYDRFAEFL